VNQEVQAEARELSAPEYVLALHAPEDQIAVLLRNNTRGQTLQRITATETVASPQFQRWLDQQNRFGADVFVGMNPLKEGATSRSKDNIREVRHIYLDLDEDASASLARIRASREVPAPNFVVDTSREKHQVVWKIEGVDLEQAESLLRSLATEFGGDAAATDAARVLRIPGFRNHKYSEEFTVKAHQESDRVHAFQDFALREDSSSVQREVDGTLSSRRALSPGHKSQSEADWAYARRALARGDDPQDVIRRIADYRADDKHDPLYYARLTVIKAQLSLFGSAERSP